MQAPTMLPWPYVSSARGLDGFGRLRPQPHALAPPDAAPVGRIVAPSSAPPARPPARRRRTCPARCGPGPLLRAVPRPGIRTAAGQPRARAAPAHGAGPVALRLRPPRRPCCSSSHRPPTRSRLRPASPRPARLPRASPLMARPPASLRCRLPMCAAPARPPTGLPPPAGVRLRTRPPSRARGCPASAGFSSRRPPPPLCTRPGSAASLPRRLQPRLLRPAPASPPPGPAVRFPGGLLLWPASPARLLARLRPRRRFPATPASRVAAAFVLSRHARASLRRLVPARPPAARAGSPRSPPDARAGSPRSPPDARAGSPRSPPAGSPPPTRTTGSAACRLCRNPAAGFAATRPPTAAVPLLPTGEKERADCPTRETKKREGAGERSRGPAAQAG
nr:formin-like protein 5 [Aegilops tauschii subsp. strangulata]